MSSILHTTKKALGLAEDYTQFDPELILFINSVLSTLNELGVGPDEGFQIEDSAATWESLLGSDARFNDVKTWLYLKVRLLFDPPATSFVIAAIEKQVSEFTWRITSKRDADVWKESQEEVAP